ncbi:hypothetical protein HY358_01170 [Candidatus Roizmanbacteria bacterium]|nr:hypothetical protein [Candidatus Roizmanbacteria bacterium]
MYRGDMMSYEAETISHDVTRNLVRQSVRPAQYPEYIQSSIETSLMHKTPLRCRIVLCPNWKVDEKGRSIEEIPVWTEGSQLIYGDPSQKIVTFLGDEVPEIISYLNRNSIRVELLVVLADILSSGWVHDMKLAKERLAQNQRAIRLLLQSSEKGKEVFNDRRRADLRVQSQLQLATNTEGYEEALNRYQVDALHLGTPMNQWYLDVVRQLQEMGEYEDKRNDLAGMRKIWERALFLAGIYALDGQVIERDFVTSRFPAHEHPVGYLALGSVATPHGDIISQGVNLFREIPIGTVTPFNNAMIHSWSETDNPAVRF